MDENSLELMKFLYPDLVVRIFRAKQDVFQATQMHIRLTQGFRSPVDQKKIYDQGRTTPGKIVTKARPGLSWHNYGLAFDVCFAGKDPYLELLPEKQSEEKWEWFARSCENHGFVAGRRFRSGPDNPHAQLTYGLQIPEAMDAYEQGGLAGVWTLCDNIRGVKREWNPLLLPPKGDLHVG